MGWLSDIQFWHWWVLAALLVILEILRPAFFFLWLGFAAAAVGFVLLVFPNTPARAQLVMFGCLCLVAVVAWRSYRRSGRPAAERQR